LLTAIVVILSVAAGTAQNPSSIGDEVRLSPKTFTLGDTAFVIMLPETAIVRESPGSQQVGIDLAKGQRLERFLRLEMTDAVRSSSFDHVAQLHNGGRLSYSIDDHSGEGSGGPIAALTGRLEIGPLVIAITCTDQDELFRRPDWCLPYLDRLELVKHDP
jgi:hypothetical protein